MNPFKTIELSKKMISTLNNKQNPIFKQLINQFESMLEDKYYSDTIAILVLDRFLKEWQKDFANNIDEIDVFRTWQNIDEDLRLGLDLKREELKSMLYHHQLIKVVKNKPNQIHRVQKDSPTFDNFINEVLNKIKTSIYFNKVQKKFN